MLFILEVYPSGFAYPSEKITKYFSDKDLAERTYDNYISDKIEVVFRKLELFEGEYLFVG